MRKDESGGKKMTRNANDCVDDDFHSRSSARVRLWRELIMNTFAMRGFGIISFQLESRGGMGVLVTSMEMFFFSADCSWF